MQLPSWLAAATGAADMMGPSRLDSFVSGTGAPPSWMDALRGVGHSMADHYRQGHAEGSSNGGLDGALKGLPAIEKVALHFAPQGGPAPAAAPPPAPMMQPPPVAQPAPTQVPSFNDPSAIMKILQPGMPAGTAGGLAGLFR